METDKKLKVLFLPRWYPHRGDSLYGLFVKRHAIAVSKYADISVLAVVLDKNNKQLYEVESQLSNGLTEIIIYIKKHQSKIILLNTIINTYRYITAHIAGWNILLQTDNKPDICHVNVLTRAGAMAFFFKKRYGIPYVITEHWSRYFEFNDTYKGVLRKFITKRIMNNATAMSTVSNALKEAMNARGLKHKKWEIIPNSIDTIKFDIRPLEHNKDTIRCFHISCFEEQSKNMSGIIRAFKDAVKVEPKLELIMIGDGEHWQQTVDIAKELGVEDKVIFTGTLENSDLTNMIDRCQFSILFSNYETFAIVIAESLACGKPVIATKVGAIPEVLPAEFGILIEPKDENALTNAIVEMAHNIDNYDADAMRNSVVEKYDAEQVGYQIFQFYKNAE